MDNPLKLGASWVQVKEMLKEIQNDLTDEDLVYTAGQTETFLQTLAKKMQRSPEEIRIWIESVSHNKGIAS